MGFFWNNIDFLIETYPYPTNGGNVQRCQAWKIPYFLLDFASARIAISYGPYYEPGKDVPGGPLFFFGAPLLRAFNLQSVRAAVRFLLWKP